MKRKYEKTNIEIIEWKIDDVIMTSDGLTDSGDITIGDENDIDDTIAGGGLKP